MRLAIILPVAIVAIAGCYNSDAGSRCGSGYLTNVGWTGGGAVVFVGAAAGDPYGGGWYDPGDDYAPPPGDDFVPPPDDTTGDPASGDPGTTDNTGDTSGDGSSGWDGTTEAVTRLHFTSVITAHAVPDGNGCYSCRIGCTAGSGATTAGRQAVGASETSFDDACRSAVGIVEQWAHEKRHAKLQRCEQVDATTSSRAPAKPTVKDVPRGISQQDRIRIPLPR